LRKRKKIDVKKEEVTSKGGGGMGKIQEEVRNKKN